MYKSKLGIPDAHDFKRVSTKSEQRKGRDTDIYEYEELDRQDRLVARYTIRDSMSIYPPQKSVVSFVKYAPDGDEIGAGTL